MRFTLESTDEIHCEEQGQIRIRGIAYPVASYRVVGLRTDPGAGSAIRAELPHLRLEVEPGLMSADEREQAVAALHAALECLDQAGSAAEPPASLTVPVAPSPTG